MSEITNKKMAQLASRLSLPDRVDLYTLDATALGGQVLYLTPMGTNASRNKLVFRGHTFEPYPMEVSGYEFKGTGSELPRPTLRMSNIGRFFTSLILNYNELVGARLTRTVTWAPYLDNGATPDTQMAWPDETFFLNRRTAENKTLVEFELCTSFELEGVQLPRRQISPNFCRWRYRSATGCGFSENRFVSAVDGTQVDASIITRHRGVYAADKVYYSNDTVSYDDAGTEKVYRALQNGFSGVAVSNYTYWVREQTYRGAYDSNTIYNPRDVAYIDGRYGREYYLYIGNPASGNIPPNTTYWLQDQCSRYLNGCVPRFDPEKRGYSMPFGGFPGASRIIG